VGENFFPNVMDKNPIGFKIIDKVAAGGIGVLIPLMKYVFFRHVDMFIDERATLLTAI
jgi:hypothetical protein